MFQWPPLDCRPKGIIKYITQFGTDRILNSPFRDVPKNGWSGRLLAGLDLPQGNARVKAALRSMSRKSASVMKCEQEQVARYPPLGEGASLHVG